MKAENSLVGEDGYIKVVDFGLAQRVAIESIGLGSGSPAGTLRYMSPEQARGESLTPASDVFSFGLVLYELATGRHAFPGASALEAVDAIMNKEPATPLSVITVMPPRIDRPLL